MVEVAAAVIERADGSFLLAQRPAGKVFAGWWEFPGGKVEAGEPAAAALARELHEEIGIEVVKAYPWVSRVHVYEHAVVMLHFYRVVEWRGEPHAREGQALAWQRLGEPVLEPMLPANGPVLASLALPLEYAITDAESLGLEGMLAYAELRLQQGLRMIQVRDKALPERDFLIRELMERAGKHGARVLVNSGPAADGIHYTAAQLMTLKSRPLQALSGASCHTVQELGRAMAIGLDFAVLGPVRATATHPGAKTLGWEGFARIAANASIPVYAIGGLTREDLDSAREAGGHGLAMIRGSWTG
ncbi:MAG: Nudix family hydrolase [Proteobacteria bacterium]|nr:Nudix family hydrolase [Pseudomonadota bacterium]MDA0983030.1 Nudix family hydrolase [Pseudomonadota bacterium]